MQLRGMTNLLPRSPFLLASIYFAFTPSAVSAWAQSQNQPFSLFIIGPQKAMTAGEACDISVTLTDVSGKPIPLRVTNGEEGAYRDFGLTVVSEPSGSLLKPIPIDPVREKFQANFSFQFKTLQPNGSMNHTLHVCKLFDLSKPGKYEVQVRRDVPKEIGTGVVISNAIVITTTSGDHP